MRLIVPLFFALVGVSVALLIRRLFGRHAAAWKPCAIVGAVGALFGLWLRDAFDQVLGDAVYGAVLAAIIGSAVLSLVLNVASRLYRGRVNQSHRER